ncbi:autotransporter-associated beta strand repeat-containing protein [Verrucomicrobium sp. BvORR034]|uniref:beta strand repeat-containing protein n=1 Tax=Verrucomicrobium sp. BvORR034 TaxID=1396418 RepID=UPI000679CEFB|nr:autotransporter-associated beta strand repeat-containing protein [Verrucomicrobium sp. BvORR034]
MDGGGKLVIDNGATLSTTGTSFLNINGGTTVEVKTGGILTSGETFIVGTTASGNGASGSGTLLISGGIVNAGANASGSRNFILGNRTSNAGDVVVTITGGQLNGNASATTGMVFENTGASSAIFNLDGGTVTVRRVLRSGTPDVGKVTEFNFNGGVLRVTETPTDASDANFAFLANTAAITYNVKEGGAIIDTNGRNILAAAKLVHAGAAAIDGGFTKRGSGILQLHGANTYTGATVIEAGTLSIASDGNLGAAPTTATPASLVINDGATLRVTPPTTPTTDLPLSTNRGIAIGAATGAGTATIEVQPGSLTYAGIIANRGTGAAGLIKTGAGVLNLSGSAANTFSGPITVKAGILRAGGAARLGTATNDPANFILDGGGFDYTGGGTPIERGIHITANGGTLYSSAVAWRLNGNITGSGTLTINVTAGFISTSGDNSAFTGDIDVAAGEFYLRKAAGMGTTAGKTTVRGNAVLSLDQNGSGGGGQVPGDNNYKDALVLENNATLRNRGGTGGGATNSIYSGTVSLQTGMAIMDIVGKVLTLQNVISGAGGINKTGVGELVVEAQNTYTGKTTVSAGTYSLGASASIADSPWLQVNSGATLKTTALSGNGGYTSNRQVFSGSGTFLGNFGLSGTSLIKAGDSTTQGLSAIANAGDLTGNLTFDGDLSFSSNASATTRAIFGLGGAGAGQFDRITITGDLDVGANTRFEVVWVNGFEAGWGQSFDLLDWAPDSAIWGLFDPSLETSLDLPEFSIGSGLHWDYSTFKDDGIIRVAPEPSRMLLLLAGCLSLLLRRRRRYSPM